MMFDNMTGAVGFAMHAERRAQARRSLLLCEAEHATTVTRGRRWAGVRADIARRLLAVAARIVPAVTMPHSRTQSVTG